MTDFYKQLHNRLMNRWGLPFITDEAGNRPGVDSKCWSRSDTWTWLNHSRGGKNIFTASKTVRNSVEDDRCEALRPHRWTYRVYSKVETSGYTQEGHLKSSEDNIWVEADLISWLRPSSGTWSSRWRQQQGQTCYCPLSDPFKFKHEHSSIWANFTLKSAWSTKT